MLNYVCFKDDTIADSCVKHRLNFYTGRRTITARLSDAVIDLFIIFVLLTNLQHLHPNLAN